jgi:hypothetical protein
MRTHGRWIKAKMIDRKMMSMPINTEIAVEKR